MNADNASLKAWRLASQKLNTQRWPSPGRMVEWLGGVQAQDYRWAKWSIGLRMDECSDEEVERAIQDRQIVRTWMFRGTLHFVAAGDVSWLTSLLAPGIIRRNARRYRQLELDAAEFSSSQRVIQQALEANSSLTRSQLKTHFQREGVPAEGQQVPYLLQRAALDGLICHGPQRGSEPTYVLVSDWIGLQPTLDRGEALRRLALRYVSSHGPATRQDFGWWAGLSAQEARSALDSAFEVRPIEADGVQYWVAGDSPLTDLNDSAYLLPPFDEYLLGYKERSLVLDPTYAKRVNAGGGMPKPTVLVNGEVLGIWNYKVKQRAMVISIQPFRNIESHERDLIDRATSQLSRFKSVPIAASFAKSDAD
jgi:hypothetical protein